MQLDRRQALQLGSRLAAGAAFAHAFSGRALGQDALVHGPGSILAVPEGFEVKTLGPTSGMPDGMACFLRADGNLALMRNQELPAPLGGVMRLVLEPKTLAVLYRDVVLSGTERNCAGGVSPWGWLSCEETFRDGHGYVYLCDPESGKASGPIRGYGHFNHEAAVVCPRTLNAHLTEDRGDGCFYRFVPASRDTPFEGELQALAAPRMPGVGEAVSAHWVPAGDPDPREDTVRHAAQRAGAMPFSRGEGLWQHGDLFYFTATSGGSLGLGQIFCYDATAATLTLVAESRGAAELKSAGCNLLIKKEQAKLAESAADIAAAMRWDETDKQKSVQTQLFPDLNPAETNLLNIIREQPEIPIDQLSVAARLTPGELASLILGLEFKGVIRTLPGKRYMVSA